MLHVYSPYQGYMPANSTHSGAFALLDFKQGDVTGDGMIDNVYLYGKPEGAGGFADHITLIIQDGRTQQTTTVNLQNNAGYHTSLFLGDFSGDKVEDIMISMETGGSGGYGIFYVYSFKNAILQKMFDVDLYNSEYVFRVDYENNYRVGVGSPQLIILFTIDISNKGFDYISQFYDENGKLKQPVSGEVLALGALYPIVTSPKSSRYDLLSFQRIIGTTNADTLGYVENLLTWNGNQFVSSRLSVSILGTPLISLY